MGILFATRTSAGDPLNFALVRGTTWNDDFVLSDEATAEAIDLTGIAGLMMRIRASREDSAHLLELSLANEKLVLVDAAAGKVGIRVSSADTLDFPENDHQRAKYVYDVVIERAAGDYEPAIAGKVTVQPQVTRPYEST